MNEFNNMIVSNYSNVKYRSSVIKTRNHNAILRNVNNKVKRELLS